MKTIKSILVLLALMVAAISFTAVYAQSGTVFAARGGTPPLYEFSSDGVMSPELHINLHAERPVLDMAYPVSVHTSDGGGFFLRTFGYKDNIYQDSGWFEVSGGDYTIDLSGGWTGWTFDIGRTGAFYRVLVDTVSATPVANPVFWMDSEIVRLADGGTYSQQEADEVLFELHKAEQKLDTGNGHSALKPLNSAIGRIQEDINLGVVEPSTGYRWINICSYVIDLVKAKQQK